ncbi:MAG TPA: DUF2007 domain-containing protein [Solirubrobacterales bacterium]|jgi:hypothetical protein|nr:DUF2007 domain-containing protein [Solirubrobacterales bacterium]
MATLVRVAYARDTVEGEMMQGLLEGAGIPSVLEHLSREDGGSRFGFEMLPRGLGGGPRRVMVHERQAEEARALLEETFAEGAEGID